MKIGVRLFISSMLFGIVVAAIYWFASHEIIGVILLALMAVALAVVAIFINVAEREANLAADELEPLPAASAGERVGTFALESYWPIAAATGTVVMVWGLVYLPGIAATAGVLGAVFLFAAVRYLAREST